MEAEDARTAIDCALGKHTCPNPTRQTEQVSLLALIHWDEYRKDALHVDGVSNDKWAATDRGWGFLKNHPDVDRIWIERETLFDRAGLSPCVGNYVRYESAEGPNGETIHACAYIFRADPVTLMQSNVRLGSRWCGGIEEAKAWVTEQVEKYLRGDRR